MSVKGTQNLSVGRAMACNKNNIMAFFDDFENLVLQLGIVDPDYIWNVDETGVDDIPKSRKVVGPKHVDLVQTVSGEKGDRYSIVTYVNAAGFSLPPMVIFKGKRYNPKWEENCPEGVLIRNSPKGYINKRLFYEYGKVFVKYLYDNNLLGRPHVILMDNHHAHLFNYRYLDMMFKRNLKVMGIPPHSSSLTQCLDKMPFRSFKDNWNKYLRIYNRKYGGKKMPKSHFFGGVFNHAWFKSMTPANIKAGWKKTGTWPINRTAIPEYKYAPSKVTDMCKMIVKLGFFLAVGWFGLVRFSSV